MLTKRASILFDKELWDRLSKDSKAKNISVGEIVRQAIEEKFTREADLEKKRLAIDRTLKHRKIFKGKIDYKELINAGRKY